LSTPSVNIPAWRQQLQPASFRGVPFGITEAPVTTGRRTVTHEYPFRDTPYVEDLGRKSREYTLTAFVVGPDYMPARDALLQAMEAFGPGKLVHPYLGTMTVQPGTCSFTETWDNGGMATFTLQFLQSDAIVYPSAVASASSSAQTNATAVNTAASAMLGTAYTLTGQDTTAITNAATGTVTDTVSLISGSLGSTVSTQGLGADAFTAAVANFKSQAAALVVSPVLLAAQYTGLINTLLDAPDGLAAVASLTRLYSSTVAYFGAKTYGSSASALVAHANDAALSQMILFGILSAAATIAVSAAYVSIQQAQATVAGLDTLFNTLVYQVTDDGLYEAVVDLQVSMDAAIPPPGQTLPSVVNVRVVQSVPSLVLCYQVYGDVSEELALVAMNDIVNPFCVPGNTVVQTLQ